KPHLNNIKTARWLADGQTITCDREIIGERPASNIASYWLGGVAAAYQKWDSIILRYLQALREYVMSGVDVSLKATINTDQGMPYFPRALKQDQDVSADSRGEDFPRFFVPDQARFLL
ncbi:terminase gpA endonuclease subunit, partial [Arthrospira platensis SPKY1]|nr:terminase gpA endonuclease subunit [Arthrospira platensis SPKY1]